MKLVRLAVAAGLAVSLSGLAAPAESAAPASPPGRSTLSSGGLPGSIVFLKDHNIWLVHPDGTGLVQVTRDGTYESPYYSPSMSDGGIIAAGNGQRIVRMQQSGTVLTSIDPPPLRNSAGQPQDGVPVDVAISPDGSRIAWSTTSYTCPIGTECGAREVTGVVPADQPAPATTTSYFGDPTWVTENRLMVHGGYLSQMMLQDLGGTARHWFDDKDYTSSSTDLGDGWLSRDGRFLVATRGYGDGTHLFTYQVGGDPRTGDPATLPTPTPDCATNTDPLLGSPTVAPDATAFAFQDSDGLTVMRVATTCDAYSATTIVPGGTKPFWSPAPIDPGAGGSQNPPGGGGSGFTARQLPKVSGKPVVGARLKASPGVWSPTPDRVSYQWTRNGKAIRGAKGRKYRVTRADRGKKLAVRVTVRGSGLPERTVISVAGKVRR